MGASGRMRMQFTTAKTHPERSIHTAAWALQRGWPLGRAMTTGERLCVLIALTEPERHLTLGSSGMSRDVIARAWRKLVKRLHRQRRGDRPLIYLGAAVTARGGQRHHLHVLLWTYLHVPMLIGQAKAVGFGRPCITVPHSFQDALRVTAYALGQHEAVFGTRNHEKNEARELGRHRWLHPRHRTLEQHAPDVLSALKTAEDRSVPDSALIARVPLFIKRYGEPA
jgi:hypothetical protein